MPRDAAPTLQATSLPTNTPLPPLRYDRSLLVYGPRVGSVAHLPADNYVEVFRATEATGDLLVEVTILNPFPETGKYWQHGFLLRDGGPNIQYRVYLNSDGTVRHYHRLGDSEVYGEREWYSPDIDRTPGGRNLLQVAMVEDVAYIYVNGQYQGRFGLDADTGGNGIIFFVDDDHAGRTNFEKFAIWRWDTVMAQDFPHAEPESGPQPTPQAAGDVHDPYIPFSDLGGDSTLRRTMPERLTAIQQLPWIADGVRFSEGAAATGLIRLALHGGDYFDEIIDDPWVVEGQHFSALESLGKLARHNPEQLKTVAQHPSVRDGVTGAEAAVLATVDAVGHYNPDLLDILLEGSKVEVEERCIELPLAGTVLLTIVRTQPGAAVTMDLLEKAVRAAEDWMGVPMLRRQVVYLFEDAATPGAGGTNFGNAIVSQPKYDQGAYDRAEVLNHLTHEVAHYYWRGGRPWISEGGANFIEAARSHAESGWPLHPQAGRCLYYDSIAALESADPEDLEVPEFSCNYSLGERLFHDLYRVLGESAFREGFRKLYLLRLQEDRSDECQGTRLTICHVEAAFKSAVSPDETDAVDAVIACWYHGDASACPDTGPPDPQTPLLGPLSGIIHHLPDNGFLEVTPPFPVQGDLMLEVTFENPYAPRESHWVYGILLRGENGTHRIYVNSWRAWRHAYYRVDEDRHGGGSPDQAPSVDVAEGGENHIRLVKIGDTGWLYVNNRLVGNVGFHLGSIGEIDEVQLLINDSGRGLRYKAGDWTTYRDLTVWQWHPSLFELPEED